MDFGTAHVLIEHIRPSKKFRVLLSEEREIPRVFHIYMRYKVISRHHDGGGIIRTLPSVRHRADLGVPKARAQILNLTLQLFVVAFAFHEACTLYWYHSIYIK